MEVSVIMATIDTIAKVVTAFAKENAGVVGLKGVAELQNPRPLILLVKLLERVGEPPSGLDG